MGSIFKPKTPSLPPVQPLPEPPDTELSEAEQKKLDAEMAAKAKSINSPDNYGAQGLQRSGNYGGNDTYSGQGSTVDRAGNVTGSQGQDLGNINDEFARGGRVAYMDGGLADMLEIYD